MNKEHDLKLINDFENESFQKGLAKICIIDKMGNKHIISLENGYMIKEKIIEQEKYLSEKRNVKQISCFFILFCTSIDLFR